MSDENTEQPMDVGWSTGYSELMEFFGYEHLPAHLQAVSKPFAELADRIANSHDRGSLAGSQVERSLEKLLEAKDCAVRAAVNMPEPERERAFSTVSDWNKYAQSFADEMKRDAAVGRLSELVNRRDEEIERLRSLIADAGELLAG